MSETKSNSQNVEKKLNKKEYNFNKSIIKVYDFFENSNENKEYKLKYILDIKKICGEIGINFDKSCEAKRVIFYKNNFLDLFLLRNPDFITQFYIKNFDFITQLRIKNEDFGFPLNSCSDLKIQQKKEPTLRIGSESLGNSTEYLSVLVMTGCLWLTCIALYGKNVLDKLTKSE